MPYSKRFDQSLAFACELHREQTRNGKDVPYINHLMAVAALVGCNGGDEDQVIGTLWYYHTLASIFEEKRPGHLADELRRVVEAIKLEGGLPPILRVPETDNSLLVDLLQDRLANNWSVLDARDFLIIEAPGHGDFLAEVQPTDLRVRAWLGIVPSQALPDEAFGTDEAARFEKRAFKALEKWRREWGEQGFKPADAPTLQSAQRAGLSTISCTQLLTRECETLDEVVAALLWLDAQQLVQRLDEEEETLTET